MLTVFGLLEIVFLVKEVESISKQLLLMEYVSTSEYLMWTFLLNHWNDWPATKYEGKLTTLYFNFLDQTNFLDQGKFIRNFEL